MKSMIFTENEQTFRRVTKSAARKAFNSGMDVMLCPSKLRPGKPWNPEVLVNQSRSGEDATFDQVVNAFEYYNTSAETGRTTNYFLAV